MRSPAFTSVIFAGFLTSWCAAQNVPEKGVIEGTVINTATGAGIGGASITLSNDRNEWRYSATSDAEGHFKVINVPAGEYTAGIEKDGFSSPAPDFNSSFRNSSIQVVADGAPVEANLELSPLQTVHGRVLNPDREPVGGAEVALSPNTLGSVITDPEGRFTFERIRAGSYTLSAKAPETSAAVIRNDGTRIAMVTTYYPSDVDRTSAQLLNIDGPGESGDYVIRMRTEPVHYIRGVVLDRDGNASSGAEVKLFRVHRGITQSGSSMMLPTLFGRPSFFVMWEQPPITISLESFIVGRQDGRFEFPNVPAGEWQIKAASTQTDDGAAGTANAFVGKGDVEGLEIRVAGRFKLYVSTEWQGDIRAKEVRDAPRPFMMLASAERSEPPRLGIPQSDRVVFYAISPGEYKLMVPPGLSARTFLGESELTGAFTVSADTPPIRAALKKVSGTIRGTVEKGEGATVVLVPQWISDVTFGQTAVSGSDGTFELNEVTPGDYFIAAFDHMDGMSPSAAVLSLMRIRGTALHVEEDLAANINLSMVSLPR